MIYSARWHHPPLLSINSDTNDREPKRRETSQKQAPCWHCNILLNTEYEPILSNSNRQTFVIAAPVLFYARNIYVNTVVDGQHNLNDGIYRKLIPILTFVRNEPRIWLTMPPQIVIIIAHLKIIVIAETTLDLPICLVPIIWSLCPNNSADDNDQLYSTISLKLKCHCLPLDGRMMADEVPGFVLWKRAREDLKSSSWRRRSCNCHHHHHPLLLLQLLRGGWWSFAYNWNDNVSCLYSLGVFMSCDGCCGHKTMTKGLSKDDNCSCMVIWISRKIPPPSTFTTNSSADSIVL